MLIFLLISLRHMQLLQSWNMEQTFTHGAHISMLFPQCLLLPSLPPSFLFLADVSHSSFILLIFGHFLFLCHIFLPYCHCASHYVCAWWRTRLTCHAGERSTAFSDQRGWLAHYYGNSSSSADMGVRFSVNSEGGELKASCHTQLFSRCY